MKTITTFKDCFDVILHGAREESRQAARRVRKLVYGSAVDGKEKYKKIADCVHTAPGKYRKIVEDWRQENFVMAVSVMYFLHDRENRPDFLFPWLFELLQHINGNIRHAAVKMLHIELGPLTVHIRHPGHQSAAFRKLTPNRSDAILFALYMSINELLEILSQPSFKKYKYLDSLPTSPYKSVQMVLSRLIELCGQNYIKRRILSESGAQHP